MCVRKTDKFVIGEIFGDAPRDAVRQQIARILSLDVDGSEFQAVGERDRVVGRLQRSYPGLRPVLFWSPYEAAAWTIIGHRIRILQAARIKQRMSEGLGKEVDVHGQRLHSFPTPQRLASIDGFPGLFERKLNSCMRSHGRHWRASSSRHNSGHAHAQRPSRNSKHLPGVGDFFAELILVRGAGDADHFSRRSDVCTGRWRMRTASRPSLPSRGWPASQRNGAPTDPG